METNNGNAALLAKVNDELASHGLTVKELLDSINASGFGNYDPFDLPDNTLEKSRELFSCIESPSINAKQKGDKLEALVFRFIDFYINWPRFAMI